MFSIVESDGGLRKTPRALRPKSITMELSFVLFSCGFVDRFYSLENEDDPRNHTNQHEQEYMTPADLTFEGSHAKDKNLESKS